MPAEPAEPAEPATLPACEPREFATPVPSSAAPVALAPARNVRREVLRARERAPVAMLGLAELLELLGVLEV